jgi:DNA topoisomerase-3
LAHEEKADSRYLRARVRYLNSCLLKPDLQGYAQLAVLDSLMTRGDVDEIVNGGDAGREGELIFAYIYEWTIATKLIRRSWVSSMTRNAIERGLELVMSGDEFAQLAEAARSRSEADWLVGMNATRAATVRGRPLSPLLAVDHPPAPPKLRMDLVP